MSSLWLNIRFGTYHLQIGPDRPWVRFSYNSYWPDKGLKPSPWFKVL
jgi:hypothetical protein